MDFHRETVGDSLHLRLTGDFTIGQAAETKPALLSALAETGELVIHLAGVAEFDSAGLQLLALAKREAQAAGKTLRLTEHSLVVAELMELYDLVGYFGDPVLLHPKAT